MAQANGCLDLQCPEGRWWVGGNFNGRRYKGSLISAVQRQVKHCFFGENSILFFYIVSFQILHPVGKVPFVKGCKIQ